MSQPTAPPPIPDYGVTRSQQRFWKGGLFAWMLFIGCAILLFMLLQKGGGQKASIPLSDFETRLQMGAVREVTVEGSRITGRFAVAQNIGGQSVLQFQTDVPKEAVSWQFVQWLLDHRGNATVKVSNNQSLLLDIIVPVIPWLLIFGFIWFFVFRNLRRQQQVPFANYPPQPPPPQFIPPAPPAT
jgi:ATP-dependent Zn protease